LNFFDFANESCDFIKSKLLKVVIFLNPWSDCSDAWNFDEIF
jgi:hypothetical protein